MQIHPEYNLKQKVYLVTDEDQKERIITGINIDAEGSLLYVLSCGIDSSTHFACEISEVKNYNLKA